LHCDVPRVLRHLPWFLAGFEGKSQKFHLIIIVVNIIMVMVVVYAQVASVLASAADPHENSWSTISRRVRLNLAFLLLVWTTDRSRFHLSATHRRRRIF